MTDWRHVVGRLRTPDHDMDEEAAALIERQAGEIARLREAAQDAKLQIEYLHGKLGAETGSGVTTLTKLRAALQETTDGR